MIATGAHTQTKSTSGKKFAFASRKFSPSATVKARVNCSFPISKFPRRRRPFLNFHTALLMIATGAHTQTKSTSGKKICFRFAKIFAFGDGAEVIF
jgi:hypothetical protein